MGKNRTTIKKINLLSSISLAKNGIRLSEIFLNIIIAFFQYLTCNRLKLFKKYISRQLHTQGFCYLLLKVITRYYKFSNILTFSLLSHLGSWQMMLFAEKSFEFIMVQLFWSKSKQSRNPASNAKICSSFRNLFCCTE